MSRISNGFDGDIELGVIGITVKLEAKLPYDVTKGKYVLEEE